MYPKAAAVTQCDERKQSEVTGSQQPLVRNEVRVQIRTPYARECKLRVISLFAGEDTKKAADSRDGGKFPHAAMATAAPCVITWPRSKQDAVKLNRMYCFRRG